jgi:hypothetical protein
VEEASERTKREARMQINMVDEHPGGEQCAAIGEIRDFLLRIHQRGIKQKEARQPIGRRAKFREETPVTRQDEEPNFILDFIMQRTTRLVQQKQRLFRAFIKRLCKG